MEYGWITRRWGGGTQTRCPCGCQGQQSRRKDLTAPPADTDDGAIISHSKHMSLRIINKKNTSAFVLLCLYVYLLLCMHLCMFFLFDYHRGNGNSFFLHPVRLFRNDSTIYRIFLFPFPLYCTIIIIRLGNGRGTDSMI